MPMNLLSLLRRLAATPALSLLLSAGITAESACAQQAPTSRFVDCSLLVASEYPVTWPTHPFPRFQLIHEQTIGPASAFNIDVLLMDGNTGTQMDVPPHSVLRPELKREKSGPFGLAWTDRIEAWQFGGEACVVDCRQLLDQAPNGVSPLVMPTAIEAFERQHRRVGFGDVVLFHSEYSDRYYRPLPEGSRYIADVIDRLAPGYPDPGPEAMEFLGQRGVLTAGTDSASMGPLPNLAEPTHYAGLKYGMIWTEGATQLSQLPATGAFYVMLSPRHANGMYAETRAFAITGGELPKRLIAAARNKRSRPVTGAGYEKPCHQSGTADRPPSPGLRQSRLSLLTRSRPVASHTPDGCHRRNSPDHPVIRAASAWNHSGILPGGPRLAAGV